MDLERIALECLDESAARLGELAKAIWSHAELGLQEHFAADLLCAELEREGFSIQRGAGQMPTAIVASWGSGEPIIGILAEYDALAGLSQKVQFTKEPLNAGAPGHGCGHNLFGVGSLGAVLAAKHVMAAAHLPGTIRFYGCPAEETLIGKVFMARDHVFDDLTAGIAWHPGSANSTARVSALAMNSFKVHFHGVAAHGAAAPHMGRSALDGCVLMDVGVNYLREHVEQEVRMHSVITAGGGAPNIVPPEATIWYYVRAPKREIVDRIYARMLDIAKGAALMSGTTYDIEFLTGCHELLTNNVISDVLQAKMEQLGGPGFTPAERAFAEDLQQTIPAEILEQGLAMAQMLAGPGVTRADVAEAASEKIIPPLRANLAMPGSTDVADVSKITPTGNLGTSCAPAGTPPHSWQLVAASGSDMGVRGMLFAAKTMSLTALELLTKPDVVAAARAEFQQATGGKPYVCALPDDADPHY